MKPVARQANLLAQTVGDELVIYDQERHRVHRLNKTAAMIWNRCDGRTTVADMALHLESPSQDSKANEDLVWVALDKLGKARLLEERVEAPSEVRDMSRRDWMRRLAMVGGAAMALPVIATISAPTPAMAFSPDRSSDSDIEIIAAGAAVTAAAISASRSGDNGAQDGGVLPCAERIPGADGSGCTDAPCGPGLRCLPSLSDPNKCVCR